MPYSTRPLLMPKIRTAGPRRLPPSPIRVLIVAWLIFGSIGSVWSFASPLMSVPDEPAHAIKAAAVARGQLMGTGSGVQGDPLVVQVPGYIANLNVRSCFAQHSNITADCAKPVDATDRGWTAGKTSAGNYNPVYYAIVGMGSRGLSGEPAIYAMRIISSWLVGFFLAAIFAAAFSLRHFRRPVIAAAVALTPAVFFLSGSINPNALEIATTGAVFLSLCAVFEQVAGRTSLQRLPLVLLTLSASLLAHTRPLSLLWLALAAIAAVLCYGFGTLMKTLAQRGFQIAMGIIALSCVFALWWVFSARSFDSLLAGAPMRAEDAAVAMLDKTVFFMVEYVGVLGWIDTMPPPGTLYTWVLGFGALLFLAYTARPVRGRWVMALLTVTVIAVPTALQASSSEKLGWIWQGRYALAMVVTLILAAGVTTRFRQFRITPWSKSMIRWGLVLGVLAHTYIFLEGLRRYTIGIQDHVNWTEMFDPRWQPPLTWQGLAVIYIALLAAGAVCLYRLLTVKRAVFSLPHAESVSAVDRA
ncbi:DUF2142 domain-containing protein [Pseudarthrobacter sp. LT1]|uniref:DUF2142 domain-containing protein n=1 Tax=Pseudarthrobacter sp. LT1 TaxID=3111450 RepID=UPI002D7941F4|nr:DUF2142 domain-containing protein [Pseudarthrobacter sp. LT1]WRT12544.1 DUF2142 domain-containing protein [Pseudarthrobacter sp. LT1]